MATYPHIERYRAELEQIVAIGGSMNELTIKPAFRNCLAAYCHEHRDRLLLLDELPVRGGLRPDGTVRDKRMMDRGYWEAKDIHDDLDAEIQAKFNRGYPRDNIIFEDSETAVLVQNGGEAMRVDMTRPGELHRLIRRFLDYELPEVEGFRKAEERFRDDLPGVLESLRATIDEAEAENAEYQLAAKMFLELCHQSIGPDVSGADVREMLLQHILTKDIFFSIFSERQFHNENNIAQQLDHLEQTFFFGDVKRQALDKVTPYYDAVSANALRISEYAEKQDFLKAIYEDFYKAYNPAAADRLGVVYTPNEVVDFIIRGADWLLQKHFGRSLADENVQILDPATGTGTFITNLIEYLPADRLEHKYLREMHANEVAILPYYIANLNIEYTYREKTGKYREFPNLVFVDTLDNMDWKGGTGGAVERQGALELGRFSDENRNRMQSQNEMTISVILGNPPYNDSATLWGDGGANRAYPEIDRRIRNTYIKDSKAQKTHQYDMYKRFIRWASDRLGDDGIIAFITNRAYIDSLQDDGFRKSVAEEFNDLYLLDLGGNYQDKGETGNVFGIRIGVAIGFLVRNSKTQNTHNVHYHAILDDQSGAAKLSALEKLQLAEVEFEEIRPDRAHSWLNQSRSDFENLTLLADRATKFARDEAQASAMFKLFSPGVKTDRDEWVYDFGVSNLRNKALYFADTYNQLLDARDETYPKVIQWSSTLSGRFRRGERIIYNDANRIQSLYRPFTVKHHCVEVAMNDRLTKNHYEMFGKDLQRENSLICIKGPSAKYFSVLAARRVVNEKFAGTNNGGTFCLPLYRYTKDGERVNNITEWGLQRINDHYREELGKRFADGESITAEDVFAYTYAVLHDPLYRHDYAVELLRELPRLPLYYDWDAWVTMGQELLELHIGFEDVEAYPLERVDKVGGSTRSEPKVMLRANAGDKERGEIQIDSETVLRGVPELAWEYKLGNRTAIEWVLDQYKEKKPQDPTIAAKFNTYRFADYKDDVIHLLRRVCTVSVRTAEIVGGMAYWEGEYLVVSGDRDKREWTMMGLQSIFSRANDLEQDVEWLEV